MPVQYQLYDMTGKLLLYGISKSNNFSINLEKLSPGFYIYKMFNGHDINILSQKLIIKIKYQAITGM